MEGLQSPPWALLWGLNPPRTFFETSASSPWCLYTATTASLAKLLPLVAFGRPIAAHLVVPKY